MPKVLPHSFSTTRSHSGKTYTWILTDQELGSGGQAVVYLGQDRVKFRDVAIKIIKFENELPREIGREVDHHCCPIDLCPLYTTVYNMAV